LYYSIEFFSMSSFFASRRPFRLLTVASTLLFAATTTGQTTGTQDASLCGISTASHNSDGQYIFNNNAWGDDGSGAQCTNVFGDGTNFETIWAWSAHGNDTHSFPNVQLNTLLFPLLMSDLAAMNLQASWTMAPVDGATRANVVYDMFVDPDKTTSGNTTTAKYEIMIWIGAFGDPFPLGASVNPFTGTVNASLPSIELAGTTFTLYSGENSGGQTVHSWLALSNQSDFEADATPLINYLTNNSLVETDAYMGILQFGSETWHSTANVTFDVTSFNLNVTSTDASANAAASAAVHPTTTSGSSGSSATGSSTSSSSSSSSSKTSGSSITSLPFWFWEIAAAGCLFAML
jgi:hypothetical protein